MALPLQRLLDFREELSLIHSLRCILTQFRAVCTQVRLPTPFDPLAAR
jgi:hypothetical protein